jgi:hypothetical protein
MKLINSTKRQTAFNLMSGLLAMLVNIGVR